MNVLANNLRRFRRCKGITQDELAEKLNVTRQTISSWETGRSEPDVQTMLLLAQSLDTDVSRLLGEENRETPPKLRKKYLIACMIFGLLAATVLVLNVTLYPYLKELTRQTLVPYHSHYSFSIPQFGYLFGGLLLSSCLCLFTPLRLPKRWRVICICVGMAFFLPALLICAETALFLFFPHFPGVVTPILFVKLYALYPPLRTIVLSVLPLLSGMLLFLGFQK